MRTFSSLMRKGWALLLNMGQFLPRDAPFPLVRWRDPITSQCQPPTPLWQGDKVMFVFSPRMQLSQYGCPQEIFDQPQTRGQWRSQKTRMWRHNVHTVLINFLQPRRADEIWALVLLFPTPTFFCLWQLTFLPAMFFSFLMWVWVCLSWT